MPARAENQTRPAVDAELLREVRRIQVRTDRLVADVVAGGYQSVFRGAGIEFEEVREWAPGDDYRSVDWNVTARAGRPFIKKFVEERELTVLLVLDRSRSMAFGSGSVDGVPKSLQRTAAELCACVGVSATRNNDKVGLLACGQGDWLYVPPKKGRPNLLRILRECLVRAPFGAGRGTDLRGALSYLGHVQRKRAIVFVVSDFCAPWPERELRLLARRHDLTLVPVLDPRLLELGAAGLLRLVDLETGGEATIDAGSPAVRQAWRDRQAKRLDDLRAMARRAGADWLPVRTDRPVAQSLVEFFRRRELQGSRR